MTTAARQFLKSFEALPEAVQHEVAVELLRRTPEGDLPEQTLSELADELFRNLDEEEARPATR